EKKNIIFNTNTTNFWRSFQSRIKNEFKEKLDSISKKIIKLVSKKHNISVKNEANFNLLFATIPENLNGLK
ncbi:18166_t:CDS:1, partial [Racocetra fulgida]